MIRWTNLSITSLLVCITLLGRLEAQEVGDSPGDVLRGLREAVSAGRRLSMRIESTVESVTKFRKVNNPSGRRVSELYRCADGRERGSMVWTVSGWQGNVYKHEYLIQKNGDVTAVQALFDDQLHQAPIDEDGISLQILMSSKRLVRDGVSVRDRQSIYGFLAESGVAIWNIGFSPVTDYLSDDPSIVQLTNNGATITSEGKFGQFSAELSKENGWLPREFSITQYASSEIPGGTVRNQFVPEEDEVEQKVDVVGETEDIPLDIFVERMEWSGRVLEFGQTPDGVWYPSRMSVDRRMVFEGGKVNSSTCQIEVEVLPNAASGDCECSIDIPTGYVVGVEKASHLPYRWEDGKPVPGIPSLPARKERSKTPAVGGNKLYLIVANLVVILVVVAILLRKRFS